MSDPSLNPLSSFSGVSSQPLLQNNRELRQLLDAVQSIVIYLDCSGEIILGNAQAMRWRPDIVCGKPFSELIDSWDAKVSLLEDVRQVAISGESGPRTSVCARDNGREMWYQIDKMPTSNDLGQLTGVLLIVTDVTESHRNFERLEYLVNHDALTSLPNRNLLYATVEDALRTRRSHQRMALLLIDLDRFKEINDTLGHLEGDKVLVQLGLRLQAELDELSGVVARLGGDEFAIFLPNVRNSHQAVVLAHRFLDAICQVFELEGLRTELSASIGVSLAPEQADDVSTLMRYADIAMYHSKMELKGVSIYDSSFDSHSPKRLELMGALGTAIREEQLCLHFQPKIRLQDNTVYGFEALLRWVHPEIGCVPPGEFVPIAEMSSVIHPMTYWVLENTIKQCSEWRRDGYKVTVAMNLSARNLLNDDIVGDLSNLLEHYQLPGEYLEMEITESMIMADPARAQSVLEKISGLGVQLSVDDFGTGYSSLSYLKRLPVQALKIDGTFIQSMLDDEQDEIIVSSTIQLAHNLGLKVVAEGVETKDGYEKLQSFGCDDAQGYYIARPMDTETAESWLSGSDWAK